MQGVVEIEGFKEYLEAIKKLPDKLKQKEIQRLFVKVSLPFRKSIKSKVAPHNKTGNLQKSVGVVRGTKSPVLVAGFTKKKIAFYGHLFEDGTKYRKGRGMMPAYKVVQRTFIEQESTLVSQSAKNITNYLKKTINRLKA